MQRKDNLVLIILSGIPCAGKSSWLSSAVTHLTLRYSNIPIIIISKDVIRETKFGKNKFNFSSKEANRIVTNEFYRQLGIAASLKNAIIIIDNTHCGESRIDRYLAIFRGMHTTKNIKILIRFFDIPLWKAHLRNIWRAIRTRKWISWTHMKEYHKRYTETNREKYKHLILNDF